LPASTSSTTSTSRTTTSSTSTSSTSTSTSRTTTSSTTSSSRSTTSTTSSTTSTTIAGTCGNGVAQGDEECDDGNTSPGDGCSPTCQLESVNPALCAGVPTGSGATLDAQLVQSGFSA